MVVVVKVEREVTNIGAFKEIRPQCPVFGHKEFIFRFIRGGHAINVHPIQEGIAGVGCGIHSTQVAVTILSRSAHCSHRRIIRGCRDGIHGPVEKDLVLHIKSRATVGGGGNRVIVGSIRTDINSLADLGSTIHAAGHVRFACITSRVVVHSKEQVVVAVVGKRRVQHNGGPYAFFHGHITRKHTVGLSDGNPIGIAVEI